MKPVLTKTSGYAVTAVAYLAGCRAEHDRPVHIDQIAAALGVPRNYLSKVLHRLAHEGILASTRGPRGGFRLARAPAELTIATVIAAFDDVGGPVPCLLQDRACDPDDPCVAHHAWHGIAHAARGFLDTTTIAALLSRTPRAPSRPGT